MTSTSNNNNSHLSHRQKIHVLKERLQRLAAVPANKLCSDCPDSKPTWASLLQAPVEGGLRFGVLCCYRCSSLHFRLGKQFCTVKNIKIVEEWTEEEIQILERGGGNQIVNVLYEARLNSEEYDKWQVKQEDASRSDFIQNKYQHLKYFDRALYQAHLQQTSSRAVDKPRRARRSISFEEQTNPSPALVRRPMRRRSQSFESTEDDQPLGYSLPSHLVNGSKRRTRRPSLPGLVDNNTAKNRTPSRRQRRTSISTKAAIPTQAELGYADDQPTDTDTDMDVTLRASNRCRGWRRKSMPLCGFGRAPFSSTLESAPKMPTRCVSDDSGDELPGLAAYETEDDGFHTPPPKAEDRIPRRIQRRASMPAGISSGDESDCKRESGVGTYSPGWPAQTWFRDPTASQSTSVYGMDLGYGFVRDASSGDDGVSGIQRLPVQVAAARMPPMPGSAISGDPAVSKPAERPHKLLDSPGGGSTSTLSSEDLGYGYPFQVPQPMASTRRTQNRRRRDSLKIRTMRRCSTGSALHHLDCEAATTTDDSPTTAPPKALPRRIKTDEDWSHRLDESARSKTSRRPSATPYNMMPSRCGYGEADRSHACDDQVPSAEDLGYGDGGGNETGVSQESLGYGVDLDLGYGDPGDYGGKRQEELSVLSSMPRRTSTRGSRRRGSIGVPSRRGSCSGTARQKDSGRANRRPSARAGEEEHCPRRAGRRSSVGAFSSMQGRPACTRRRSSVAGTSTSPAPQQSLAPGSLLGTSRIMRSDSISSACSEISLNAALLYAGHKKYNPIQGANEAVSNPDNRESQQKKDDSNVSSISPVSVSLVAYFGKAEPLDCAEKGSQSNRAESTSLCSKKDYWKAKLRESALADASLRQSEYALSSQQRRTRRASMTTAYCA